MRVWKPDGNHCDTPDPDGKPVERTTEVVEAEVRKTMAQHAAIQNRGWQTARDRDILHRRIDRLLDEYAYLVMSAAVSQ